MALMRFEEKFVQKVKNTSRHLQCLIKAMERTRRLLVEEASTQDDETIHSAKSILYAAIEQLGVRIDRLTSVQRMLRELLSIVNAQYNSPGHDKQVALQILDELEARTPLL